MSRTICIIFSLLFSTCIHTQAQEKTVIYGQVIDAQTKEALSFVNIYVNPSYEGTTSDLQGHFYLSTTKKVKSIVFSFLGYENREIIVSKNQLNNIVVELTPSNIMINEAVIVAKKENEKKKDTAAITLYRNVVKYKEKNRPKAYDSYQYTEHSKVEFDLYKLSEKFTQRKILRPFQVIFDYIDTTASGNSYLPVLLQEEITQQYYRKQPKKEKKIVVASQLSGAEDLGFDKVVGDMFPEFDVYDNIISAGGKPFPSPFSNSGLVTYRYFLLDSMIQNGKKYYRLDFTPRSKQSIAFTGYAWVEDSSFAIRSMEFKIPSKANLNFINDFYIFQGFTSPDGEHWFMDEEEIHISINLRKNKNKGSLLVKRRKKRDHILINEALPDSLFDGEKIEYYSDAGSKDTSWWSAQRIAPLTDTEEGISELIDSVKQIKAYKRYQYLMQFATSAFLRAGPIEFGRFYKLYSFNNIEGNRFKIGVRSNKYLSKKVRFWTYAAYGLKDKQWKGFGSLRFMLPKKNEKWQVLELSYFNDFTFLGQPVEEQLFTHDNLFLSILRRSPLEKIMRIENYTALYEKEWIHGLYSRFTLSRRSYFQVPNVFEFDRLEADGGYTSIPSFQVSEASVMTRIGIGQKWYQAIYYRFPTTFTKPILDITYSLAVEDVLGGDYTYHKFELEYFHRYPWKLGYTKYWIKAGKIIGESPYPLMFLPVGNEGFYYNQFAYDMMQEFEYAMDEYAAVWIDHHFDGRIFNRIPGIKYLQLRSLVTFKALIGNASNQNINLIEIPEGMSVLDNWYIETGFGIENILKAGRIDFLWRVTQQEKPDVRKFGIRFSIQPSL